MINDFKPFSTDNNNEIKRLDAALTAAGVGTWELDLATNQFLLCRRFNLLFNNEFENITTLDKILAQIHPDHIGKAKAAIISVMTSETDEPLDVEFRLARKKNNQERWINLKGQLEFNAKGRPHLLAGAATEVTGKVASLKNLEASEARFRSLIQQAPVSTCLFVGKEMRIEIANEKAVHNWGKGWAVIGKPIAEALPELASQKIFSILDQVFISGSAYEGKAVPICLERNGVAETNYYDFTFKPIRNAAGEVYAILDMAVDVTDKIVAQKSLEESEARLRSVIANTPVAIGLFVSRELVVEMPNQAFIDIVGKGNDIIGRPLREVMPELESQAFLGILDEVYTSGKPYQSPGIQVDIVRNGVMTHNFYNITYSPLFDQEGQVYAVLDIAIDVTDRMMEQKLIEESQMELLALFEQSPVAIAIISGPDLVFEMANTFYGQLVGRPTAEIIGKPLLEALPELQGQGFDLLLQNVMTTGKPFISHEQSAQLIRNDKLDTIYVDLNYQPRKTKDNRISGVLVVATDVTGQVLARKEILEAESMLREAVELAELGTWQIDLKSNDLYFSPRLRSWFNISEKEDVTLEKIYAVIREKDLPVVQDALNKALLHGKSAVYDVEFELKALSSGMKRILHAVGSAVYNEKGEPVKISGNVHDVTIQRELQLSLEYQVQSRTEELEATNEELAAINDQFTSANDELAKTNQMLTRSNENLQRFAYVASHDLQEPLRKIQSFGDLLRSRFPEELGGGAEYLFRMQAAAKRMSALIEDLLAFSRISDQENTAPVPLNEVANVVLNDLELVIHQTNATISIGTLPTIQGDRLQLGQLFQNLISNALKFRKEDVRPEIHILAKTVPIAEIPQQVQPTRLSETYHQIDIIDNGIGFDNKHVGRIFQIFQRLHGKTEFVGTGIGLAICEKVAASHGGAITAASEIDRGATFSLFIPV